MMNQSLTLHDDLQQKIKLWAPSATTDRPLNIFTDTTEFFDINYGDVILLNNHPFLVRHNAKEGRFGLDDEVKYWVKRAIDIEDGSLKIIKLTFFEQFNSNIAGIIFENFRSPRKEARILNLVKGHPRFMQGYSVNDAKENIVRVIDHIPGPPLSLFVEGIDLSHEEYFFTRLPDLLAQFIECVDAIGFLHNHMEKHGDIRRDHILIDSSNHQFRWIDFDYNYKHRENIFGYDLFGLGNILVHLVGKGDITLRYLEEQNPQGLASLTSDDLNIVWSNRVANLKKIYPYIPQGLNQILLHFSQGSHYFYEFISQLKEDLLESLSQLRKTAS